MGTRRKGKRYIYRRGSKLWMGFTHPVTGKEEQLPTGLPVGQEKKAAKVRDDLIARIEAGAEFGEQIVGTITVAKYAKAWIDERKKGTVSTWKDDDARLKRYILPVIGHLPLQEVRPRAVRGIVKKLKSTGLAPRTIRNIYGTMRVLFNDAVAEELIDSSPCVLKRRELPKNKDKDPTWRKGAVFDRSEFIALITSELIPIDRRVMYAILGLGGLRFGEASALCWRDYDANMAPLGRLSVAVSFNTDKRMVKELKTETPRQVPVHPILAQILAAWASSGWPVIGGRAPTPDDLIVPSRRMVHRSRHHMLTKLYEDLEKLGLRRRRLHDLRRTFISLARADGARKDLLEVITHGPRGNIVDVYTEFPWAFLCDEVSKLTLNVELPPAPKLALAEPVKALSCPEVGLQFGLQSPLERPNLPSGKDFSWWRRRESNTATSRVFPSLSRRLHPVLPGDAICAAVAPGCRVPLFSIARHGVCSARRYVPASSRRAALHGFPLCPPRASGRE